MTDPWEFPVIDGHLHLDHHLGGSACEAVAELERQMAETGTARGILLHLQAQPWPLKEVAEALARATRLVGFVNLHPMEPAACDTLTDAIRGMGFRGLKLHPRLQQFQMETPECLALCRRAGELGVPVLLDAFPDGDAILAGFDPRAYARVARACPDTRFIVAHFAGHHCLEMMMLAKRTPNLFLDISYSLLYYRGSSVPENLVYCCRSMQFQRIFYGSDYPDRTLAATLSESRAELTRLGVELPELKRLFYTNIKEFFQWTDI